MWYIYIYINDNETQSYLVDNYHRDNEMIRRFAEWRRKWDKIIENICYYVCKFEKNLAEIALFLSLSLYLSIFFSLSSSCLPFRINLKLYFHELALPNCMAYNLQSLYGWISIIRISIWRLKLSIVKISF